MTDEKKTMQFRHKEQECEELQDYIKSNQEIANFLNSEEKDILLKINGITKEFGIEYIKDIKTGEIIYRSNKILQYKQALEEIEEIAKHENFLVRDPFCGTGYRDLSGQILNIIKRAKEGK